MGPRRALPPSVMRFQDPDVLQAIIDDAEQIALAQLPAPPPDRLAFRRLVAEAVLRQLRDRLAP